ncbi:MAG: NUDIX hydrolase [Candidatus Niyogibacteria bacterium]|nr:MAG: NUDIX hydrolase [Candidatus Niyogibacteria bacterium]
MTLEHTLDEYLDLVDENDNVVGKKKRSEVYADGLSNFRVVNVFIVNSKGEIWIPRRAADKRIYPLCLDMSMGGHVESGESYEDAFKRELREELNIDVDKAVIHLLGHLTPRKDGVSAYMKVYEIKMDETPNYNKNDFTEYFWLTPKALFERISNGEKTKGDLPKLVKIFYQSSIL